MQLVVFLLFLILPTAIALVAGLGWWTLLVAAVGCFVTGAAAREYDR